MRKQVTRNPGAWPPRQAWQGWKSTSLPLTHPALKPDPGSPTLWPAPAFLPSSPLRWPQAVPGRHVSFQGRAQPVKCNLQRLQSRNKHRSPFMSCRLYYSLIAKQPEPAKAGWPPGEKLCRGGQQGGTTGPGSPHILASQGRGCSSLPTAPPVQVRNGQATTFPLVYRC